LTSHTNSTLKNDKRKIKRSLSLGRLKSRKLIIKFPYSGRFIEVDLPYERFLSVIYPSEAEKRHNRGKPDV